MILPVLFISETINKGKGVFTKKKIAPGTLIEESPVIVMNAADRVHLDQTLLHDYIFEWGNDKDKCAMALGYLSVYNHSYTSNCEYYMDFSTNTIQVKSIREIAAGEELTINYNGDWNDSKKVWFDVKN